MLLTEIEISEARTLDMFSKEDLAETALWLWRENAELKKSNKEISCTVSNTQKENEGVGAIKNILLNPMLKRKADIEERLLPLRDNNASEEITRHVYRIICSMYELVNDKDKEIENLREELRIIKSFTKNPIKLSDLDLVKLQNEKK